MNTSRRPPVDVEIESDLAGPVRVGVGAFLPQNGTAGAVASFALLGGVLGGLGYLFGGLKFAIVGASVAAVYVVGIEAASGRK